MDAHLDPGGASPRPRPQHEVRDRRNAGQRLAAKTKSTNSAEILRTLDLAGRVPLDRKPCIVRLNAFAALLDPEHPLGAEFNRNRNTGRAGVNGVLDQLLDDGGRAL